MHEGLELLRIADLDARQMGAILAISARGQGLGGTVRSILASLESSAAEGSGLAKSTLAAYQAADETLKNMAAGAKHV